MHDHRKRRRCHDKRQKEGWIYSGQSVNHESRCIEILIDILQGQHEPGKNEKKRHANIAVVEYWNEFFRVGLDAYGDVEKINIERAKPPQRGK